VDVPDLPTAWQVLVGFLDIERRLESLAEEADRRSAVAGRPAP
jgi:hypothetical protein